MIRLILILLSCVAISAQRTPFNVNGSVVNNPNLTNTSTVTWTVNGANIIGAVTDPYWSNSGTTIITRSNSPVKLIVNTGGLSTPLILDNQVSSGTQTILQLAIITTNTFAIQSSAITDNNVSYQRHSWEVLALDNTQTSGTQLSGDSGGDVFLGFPVLTAVAGTNGFVHIPSMAGTPTGTPFLFSATRTALVFDRINNRLWAYNTNWFDVSGQVLNYSSTAATSQYLLLKPASATTASIAGAADIPFGIAMNSTTGSSQSIQVMTLNGSVFNMVATNTVTLGTLLEPGPNGTCRTLSGTGGTHYIIGMALETKTNTTVKVKTDLFLRDI